MRGWVGGWGGAGEAEGGGEAEAEGEGEGEGEGELHTESHESAWMAASLSVMYWPCAVRFSAARFPLFSLSSA